MLVRLCLYAFVIAFGAQLALTPGCARKFSREGLLCNEDKDCGAALKCVDAICAKQGTQPADAGPRDSKPVDTVLTDTAPKPSACGVDLRPDDGICNKNRNDQCCEGRGSFCKPASGFLGLFVKHCSCYQKKDDQCPIGLKCYDLGKLASGEAYCLKPCESQKDCGPTAWCCGKAADKALNPKIEIDFSPYVCLSRLISCKNKAPNTKP